MGFNQRGIGFRNDAGGCAFLRRHGSQQKCSLDDNAVDAGKKSVIEESIFLHAQIRLPFEAGPRPNQIGAEPVVDRRFDEFDTLALLLVIVGHRKQIHRLGTAHRAISEIKFSHIIRQLSVEKRPISDAPF